MNEFRGAIERIRDVTRALCHEFAQCLTIILIFLLSYGILEVVFPGAELGRGERKNGWDETVSRESSRLAVANFLEFLSISPILIPVM